LSEWFPYFKLIQAWLNQCPDDGGSKHLWNIRELLPYMALPHRRQPTSNTVSPWSILPKNFI
jgi:hypothetical protein